MRNIMRCNIYTRAQSSHEKSITMKKKILIYTLYISNIYLIVSTNGSMSTLVRNLYTNLWFEKCSVKFIARMFLQPDDFL